jgi:hypothetical protein
MPNARSETATSVSAFAHPFIFAKISMIPPFLPAFKCQYSI